MFRGMMSLRSRHCCAILGFLLLPCWPAQPLFAQAEPAPPDAAAEPAAVTEAENSGPKITIHGYLTQAYAASDGFQILGIPEEGTSDYRTAALQIRADISPDDVFVAQLSHERFGLSRLAEIKDDVELDYVFYERHFGNTVAKVGRVPLPFGIYNEVRDVGTLLPFYRPSHNFYGEAAYSSETVDGIVVSHDVPLGDWRLKADAHYGNWEFVQRDFFTGAYAPSQVDDSIGLQVWLETPLPGLRVGGGVMEYNIQIPTGETTWRVNHFSLSGEFDRFAVHGEIKDAYIGMGAHVYLGYLHGGFRLTEKLTLNGQKDFFYIKIPGTARVEVDDDRALGLNYAFRSWLVVKAEHHWNEGGFWLENGPPPLPGAAVPETRYWLLSLSSSF
jgi:hypothetical protein